MSCLRKSRVNIFGSEVDWYWRLIIPSIKTKVRPTEDEIYNFNKYQIYVNMAWVHIATFHRLYNIFISIGTKTPDLLFVLTHTNSGTNLNYYTLIFNGFNLTTNGWLFYYNLFDFRCLFCCHRIWYFQFECCWKRIIRNITVE